MRSRVSFVALVAFLSVEGGLSLMMKRPGGTEPVSVELAEEGVETATDVVAPPSPSRFIDLSHKARGRKRSPHCLDEDCEFVVQSARARKTQQQKLKKKAKKLEKKAKKEKEIYLQNHTEEEYQVLKYQAIVDALQKENAAAAGGGEGGGEEAQQGQ
ncbi:hypothetical protein, conserved [Eimeria praecox]|uniref:Secreted protein n=1 Tax=Eimeria praecox TaxID=51316 RepID=U6H0D7_9EIME|nr:hypothetical protein, conserved [Eimeria praecox]